MTPAQAIQIDAIGASLMRLSCLLDALSVGAENFGPAIDVGACFSALHEYVEAVESEVQAIPR
jgi:hypothetical protein